MPEGHVIHKLARELTDKFGGKQVRVSSPQGRFADAAAILDGPVLEDADAVGKHLFINFEARQCVWIHLGLIGKFRFKPLSQIENYDTLRLLIADSKIGAELRGPQWCRLITPEEKLAVIAKSGPDPLRETEAFLRLAQAHASLGVSKTWVGPPLGEPDPAGWTARVAEQVLPRVAGL